MTVPMPAVPAAPAGCAGPGTGGRDGSEKIGAPCLSEQVDRWSAVHGQLYGVKAIETLYRTMQQSHLVVDAQRRTVQRIPQLGQGLQGWFHGQANLAHHLLGGGDQTAIDRTLQLIPDAGDHRRTGHQQRQNRQQHRKDDDFAAQAEIGPG